MPPEKDYPNLYKQNILPDDPQKDSILKSTQIAVKNYNNYIDECKKWVEKQAIIFFELRPTGNDSEYEVLLDDLQDKAAESVQKELFDNDKSSKSICYKNEKGKEHRAKIATRSKDERLLVLEEAVDETITQFYCQINTYQLKQQKKALISLIDKPKPHYTSLLKLFDSSSKGFDYFANNIYEDIDKESITYKVLTDDGRDGNDDQQNFVHKALQTKDFALLEGPPGSGKTTAIIELILQLIAQDKRVLLVSATHVAVDNVIDRILTTYKEQCQGKVVPLRVGKLDNIRKESVQAYQVNKFLSTTKKAIRKNLRAIANPSDSQQKLLQSLPSNEDETSNTLDDIILKSANLVGGTMMGILQYPEIKSSDNNDLFDVMIVDESSKVTFLDFIVPALYAKKWILVGDVQQLSPYVEDDYLSEFIDSKLEDKTVKLQLMQRFEWLKDLTIRKKKRAYHISVLVVDNWRNYNADSLPKQCSDYTIFEIKDSFDIKDNKAVLQLNAADAIVCTPSSLHWVEQSVFVKIKLFGNTNVRSVSFLNRQKNWHYYNKLKRYNPIAATHKAVEADDWKSAIASRLAQYYQYRLDKKFAEPIKQELELLIPNEAVRADLEHLRKMALPSILELLQTGIGETKSKKGYTQRQIIYEGFNKNSRIKDRKFQTLQYQHRMDETLAAVSKKHFYNDDRLNTANRIKDRLNPFAKGNPNYVPISWISNKGKTITKDGKKLNANRQEVKDIITALKKLEQHSRNYPKAEAAPYEVAVLTFYRQQEFEIKKELRKWTGQYGKHKFFDKGNLKITLCTVDKFQGDEADVVLLSFVKTTPKAFYHNPNRLNVALTRARYKLLLFGNRKWMQTKSDSPALRQLATDFEAILSNRYPQKK